MKDPGACRDYACFTADVEQDCPPYLKSCHGMSEGLPRLLDLLSRRKIRGTFFTTGEMARRFPNVIRRLVDEGHELGCHGDLHLDFTTLNRHETQQELADSLATLRQFASVKSFRAPYLRFPTEHLSLLVEHGLRIDSSVARYKTGPYHNVTTTVVGLARIPASATSSVLRLPRGVRSLWLRSLKPPLMLFVHPWEAVDFRSSSLRWDCRFRTGQVAIDLWEDTLRSLQDRGQIFLPLREMVELNLQERGVSPASSSIR